MKSGTTSTAACLGMAVRRPRSQHIDLDKKCIGRDNVPFVFVHGVNTRHGEDYQSETQLRDTLLNTVIAPALGIDATQTVSAPYWGNRGVKFTRNLSVIPTEGEEVLGTFNDVPLSAVEAAKAGVDPANPSALSAAQREIAIDVLFDIAAANAKGGEIEAIASAFATAAATGVDPQWFAAAGNMLDVASNLYEAITERQQGEQLGAADIWNKLKEAAQRVPTAVQSAASLAVLKVAREPLTRTVASFLGDAFVYLKERGNGSAPGPIASIVLESLRNANAMARTKGEPLVVVCHSFGGEIVYDILTHYARKGELEIDWWITVGSQVALFEEMSLYLESPGRDGAPVPPEAISMPACVKRWLNVFDTNDVLSFAVKPVFTASVQQIEDFRYNTGQTALGAHSGYWRWPSFYRRLTQRMIAGA